MNRFPGREYPKGTAASDRKVKPTLKSLTYISRLNSDGPVSGVRPIRWHRYTVGLTFLGAEMKEGLAMSEIRHYAEKGLVLLKPATPKMLEVATEAWTNRTLKKLLDDWATDGIPGYLSGEVTEIDISQDVQLILSEDRAETTKKQLIDARCGQGNFRSDLLKIWNGQCAVTGCATLATLRASHVKPWSASTDFERLDPLNGLLLVANLDALFDRGLISFEDDGTIIISKQLTTLERDFFQLDAVRISQQFADETKAYLDFHRETYFQLGKSSYPTIRNQ